MRRLIALLLVAATLPLAARTRSVRSGPTETPAAWLRARAIHLDRLDPLLHLTRNATVIALGDATHGTHELYAAKQQLIPFFVERAGFRTIALEWSYAEAAAVDAYVRTGLGDPAKMLEGKAYWFWDTQETLDLILWAREQNARGLTPRIRIAGVDSSEPETAAQLVVTTLRRVDPAAAGKAELAFGCLLSPPSDLCRANIASVRSLIRRDVFASTEDYEELLHAVRVVEQGELIRGDVRGTRDAVLAENILHLANRGDKVVVWGHNEHWGRTDYQLDTPTMYRPAGAWLHDSLGTRYFTIGSVILDGTIAIVADLRLRVLPMAAAHADDYARLFDLAGLETMIVPLHNPLPSWLAGQHHIRISGSGAAQPDVTIDLVEDLPAKFDAVMYVRSSTPTWMRHWPVW